MADGSNNRAHCSSASLTCSLAAASCTPDIITRATAPRLVIEEVQHGLASNTLSVDERSERIARRFETPLLIAAVLVIPLLILEEGQYG
jgi:hypothetical protein